jgi:predicted metal-dependent HD superfamily phosphohydrolase
MQTLESQIKSLLALPLVKKALKRLQKELPKELKYHNYLHTMDVVKEALCFGISENLSERELHLLGIAAVFHDTGFLQRRENNEVLGAAIAAEALQEAGGYTAEETRLICKMIEDTKLIHTSLDDKEKLSSKLSGYLLDADVSNFGKDDFFEKSACIIDENGIIDKKGFYRDLLELLLQHRWYTKSAFKLRQAKKEENIAKLRQLIL